jgi:diguanylate cyclase (GGDEF)-like protein
MVVLGWVMTLRKRVDRQAGLLRESEDRFRFMAQHDALTGLANRPMLQDRLNVALESAKRRQVGLTLMMLDLDKFKEINDGLGHHAGDEVLRITSNRLVEIFRKSDTVARLGGDEFVALLPDLSDPNVAATLAAKVVAALSVPISFEGGELRISVSVGVCIAAPGQLDADALMKTVDAALYRAKARGRNCYEMQDHGSAAA